MFTYIHIQGGRCGILTFMRDCWKPVGDVPNMALLLVSLFELGMFVLVFFGMACRCQTRTTHFGRAEQKVLQMSGTTSSNVK